MHCPENWWRFAVLILNFVGSMLLLWHSGRVMRITPAYNIAVAAGVSSWPWHVGFGLNIAGLGFARDTCNFQPQACQSRNVDFLG
jgi:hypothetical protein